MKFVLYWNDGTKETVSGKNLKDAFPKNKKKRAFHNLHHYQDAKVKHVWGFFNPNWLLMDCSQAALDKILKKKASILRIQRKLEKRSLNERLSLLNIKSSEYFNGQLMGIEAALNCLCMFPNG